MSLTKELASILNKVFLPDLTERARTPEVRAALEQRFAHERKDQRTAESFDSWVERTVEQVGAAWILSCIFVRTLEDRGFLAQRRIVGKEALSSEQLFFELAPSLTLRDYLLTVFREIATLPGSKTLLDAAHNPAWKLSPSNESVVKLVELLRRVGDDGTPVWRFDANDTRILGDLYQDLSASVRERYALKQTPDFVEEFILDETLEPAIQEFGLEKVRLIDPTCGSGHFLLGAFHRLFEHHERAQPGLDPREVSMRALSQVYGVDLNPYAVAIARFRLTVAFLQRAGITRLSAAPKVPLNLVVADSLLHGGKDEQLRFSEKAAAEKQLWMDELFSLEDPAEEDRILGQRYHAVVGNPPYITCKDSALREAYRSKYDSAAGKYALAAPFTERFFQLAVPSGFVGMINANSFMKREFGKKLIEVVLPRVDLTKVIDTSGAYIPGHGTPTVLLFGRSRAKSNAPIPVVMGKRGEPGVPGDAGKGRVWISIVQANKSFGFENEFVSTSAVEREVLEKHPWSIGGGGAAELKQGLEETAKSVLRDSISTIGFSMIAGEDDFFARPNGAWARVGAPEELLRPLCTGEFVRDWRASSDLEIIFPYDINSGELRRESVVGSLPVFWPWKPLLWARNDFSRATFKESGRDWFEFHQIPLERFRIIHSIAFGEVATHNHFALDRSGLVFNRTAPVIKLPPGATEEEHHQLVGPLNSSLGEFWMKQVFQPKGGDSIGDGGRVAGERWEERFQRDGTKLKQFPLPPERATMLGRLAREIAYRGAAGAGLDLDALRPGDGGTWLRSALVARQGEITDKLLQMVALQEELDWHCYRAYGLIDDTVRLRAPEQISGLTPGFRPFEILLARTDQERRAALARGEQPDEMPTAWFERHGWDPQVSTEALPPEERAIVEERIAIIQSNKDIALIEQAAHKRRWYRPDYEAEEWSALERWLSDRLEAFAKAHKRPFSARDAAHALSADPAVQAVVELLSGSSAFNLEELLRERVNGDQVPFLPAQVFTEAGLLKRAQWERTWELQREEDAGKKVEVPVPPKYDAKDFRDPGVYSLRGKLDVPKERFISYPGLQKDDANSDLIAWAGLNHLERAQVLADLYQQRITQDGWTTERLVPLLAGLLDLIPWVKQWHNAPNPNFDGERMGDFFEQFLDEGLRTHGLTRDELRAWRPAAKKASRGRRKAS